MKEKISEFIASQDLNLFLDKEGKPCGSEEGAIPVKVTKGGNIPEVFITNFLLHNRNFIGNLPMKNALPDLTEAQQKKYDLVDVFSVKPEKLRIPLKKYDRENLTIKANKMGARNFKLWAEKEFGDQLDRRKSISALITDILKMELEV